MYNLRPYQQEAVDKLIWSQGLKGADLGVLPTGAGKSIVIAELAHQANSSVLIIQPSKEILEQNYNKLKMYVGEEEIGIYSASANRKDIGLYTFATIQSIYKHPEQFNHFKYIIIDECHLVNPKDKNSMFMKFLRGIGEPKVVGLTATPYRLDVAYIRTGSDSFIARTGTKLINRVKGNFWSRIVFNINIKDLIEKDYLCNLKYLDKTIFNHRDIPVNKSRSDFNLSKYKKMMEEKKDQMLEAIYFTEEICDHVLVFCSTVEQAESLSELVDSSEVVTAKTSKKERERIISDFRGGNIKTVLNVGVLTTGFDFPELDGIVLLRPTKSIALYYQMLGRGVRKSEGKKNCKVVDLTGTVKFLGRVETIELVREKMWELKSETGYWHNKPLYEMEINY